MSVFNSKPVKRVLRAAARLKVIRGGGPGHNLPPLNPVGFFGRRQELDSIAWAFGGEGVRRLNLSGDSGRGKTSLANQAGRRLLREGRFRKICYVDFADFQGRDAVGTVLSEAGQLAEAAFADPEELRRVMSRQPWLLILDDLDSLDPGVGEALLARALDWSGAGKSRVLLINCPPDTAPTVCDPDGAENRELALTGFQAEDADAYCRRLLEAAGAGQQAGDYSAAQLAALLGRVDYHPLCINLLARQLREVPPANLNERLNQALQALPAELADRHLAACLNLAFNELDERTRDWLPRLGVVQGGALERILLKTAGFGQAAEDNPTVVQGRRLRDAIESGDPAQIARAMGMNLPAGISLPKEAAEEILAIARQNVDRLNNELAQAEQKIAEKAGEPDWTALRRTLTEAGLIQARTLTAYGSIYLKYHPALKQALWSRLSSEEQDNLRVRHRSAYYELARELYDQVGDQPEKVRMLARLEMPNLLSASRESLQAEEQHALSFATYVKLLLDELGLKTDHEQLEQETARHQAQVQAAQSAFLGNSHYHLKRHAQLIIAVVAIIGKPENRPNLEQGLATMERNGWEKLVAAIRRILEGERNQGKLCEDLDREDATTVKAILEGIANPMSLQRYISELQATPLDTPALRLSPQQSRLVIAIVAGIMQPQLHPQLEHVLKNMERKGWNALVATIYRIIEGERDMEVLSAELEDASQRLMVKYILEGMEKPESLKVLM